MRVKYRNHKGSRDIKSYYSIQVRKNSGLEESNSSRWTEADGFRLYFSSRARELTDGYGKWGKWRNQWGIPVFRFVQLDWTREQWWENYDWTEGKGDCLLDIKLENSSRQLDICLEFRKVGTEAIHLEVINIQFDFKAFGLSHLRRDYRKKV